jgi:hypothetical protein
MHEYLYPVKLFIAFNLFKKSPKRIPDFRWQVTKLGILSIPITDLCGPEGSGRLRLPDSMI